MFGITEDFSHLTGFALYLAIFALPFVQEDAAVIGAATASMHGVAPTSFLVAAILSGLIASDAWKYWIGRLARRYEWAHKFAEKPGVSVAGDLVRVPAGMPHWFDMGPRPRFTAIRLFTNPEGWVAHYTGSDIARRFPRHEPAS